MVPIYNFIFLSVTKQESHPLFTKYNYETIIIS